MEKYKIFVSSTIEDLAEAREAVDQILQGVEIFEPVRIETLPATENPSQQVCLDGISQSDAVVLIIGGRYGFIPVENNPEKLSITHLEYREARRQKKDIFAFVLRDVERDEDLQKFKAEVESFDQGVFRKEWDTPQDLANEVRRSLLWWIARRARSKSEKAKLREVVTKQLRSHGLDEVAIVLENGVEPPEVAEQWLGTLVGKLQRWSAESLVPTPTPNAGSAKEACFRLRVLPVQGTQEFRIEITFPIPGEPAEANREGLPGTEVSLGLQVNPDVEGMATTELVAKAYLFLAAEDPSRCVEVLLAGTRKPEITKDTSEEFLFAAGLVNLRYRLDYGFTIGEYVLALDRPSPRTLQLAALNLFALTVRFGTRKLPVGESRAERMYFELLFKGLTSGVLGSEAAYSLARKILEHGPRHALLFYQKLVDLDPYYEERWYWHRDIGLIYYGENKYREAALHYDKAIRLKPDYSELFRFAGDAYYYEGHWVPALERYERALQTEPTEDYFVDAKIGFAIAQVRRGIERDNYLRLKRSLAETFTRIAVPFARSKLSWIARLAFRIATRITPLCYEAPRWLGLYANRRGENDEAIYWLEMCLASIPENPFNRLNLALNMIFKNQGKWTDISRKHARAAVFHSGPAIKDRFKVSLVNTANRDALLADFEAVIAEAMEEREARRHRMRNILKPEQFGDITHVEFRQ